MPWLASLQDAELSLLHRIVCLGHSEDVERFATWVGEEVFTGLVFLLVFLVSCLFAARRARAVRTALALVLGFGAVHGVKALAWNLAPRPRPGALFTEAEILRGRFDRDGCASVPELWVERAHPPKSPGFPSSHAISVGVVAATLARLGFVEGVFAWFVAAAVGWSRLYYGKHWPSDVAGGFVLAALCAWGGWWAAGDMLARLRRRRARPAAS